MMRESPRRLAQRSRFLAERVKRSRTEPEDWAVRVLADTIQSLADAIEAQEDRAQIIANGRVLRHRSRI